MTTRGSLADTLDFFIWCLVTVLAAAGLGVAVHDHSWVLTVALVALVVTGGRKAVQLRP